MSRELFSYILFSVLTGRHVQLCDLFTGSFQSRKGLNSKSFHLALVLLAWVFKGCAGQLLEIR